MKVVRGCSMERAVFGLLTLCVGLVTGCTTMADASNAQGQGVSKTFAAPFDVVWKAVPEALSSLGLPVAAENKQDGYILAEHGASAFSWGEKVAVFLTRVAPNETKVEVVSKRALATNITARDWGPDVLQRVEQMLVHTK